MPRADSLPSDVEGLKRLLFAAHDQVQRLSAQLHSRDVLIEKMKLQLAQLKRMKFGRSFEQLDAQIAQLELSLEELEANAAEVPIAAVPATPLSTVTKPTRQARSADLPRESHRHKLNTGTCNCLQCGGTYVQSTAALPASTSFKRTRRRDRSSVATPAPDYSLT